MVDTIINKIKDFDDILYSYGDKNLIREYRKIFGFSYDKRDCEHEYEDLEGGLYCMKCGDLITKSMMYRQNLIDRVKLLKEISNK